MATDTTVYETRIEWDAAYDAFCADVGALLERHDKILRSPKGYAYDDGDDSGWDVEYIELLGQTPITGWVFVIERYDPASTHQTSFNTFQTPAMQPPSHTSGLLAYALESSK